MYVIGLTGGIASGKSTVSRRLTALGAALVDTDQIAHALAEPGAALWQAYAEHFGAEILRPDRTLDRAAVARLVFSQPAQRQWMDQTAHPLILAACREQLAAHQAKGCQAAVLDVPLLFEVGWDAFVDEVWVVAVTPAVQLCRLMERNALTQREAEVRIAAQLPLAEKCGRADLVLNNDGTVEQLLSQVDAAWQQVISRRDRV